MASESTEYILICYLCEKSDVMEGQEKEHKVMAIDTIMDLLKETRVKVERLILHEGFAVNLDISKEHATPSLLDKIMIPYQLKDCRIVRILSGKLQMELNFTVHELEAGDLAFFKSGTYFQIIAVSDDIRCEAMALEPARFQSDIPLLCRNVMIVHPDAGEWNEIGHMILSVYMAASHEPFRKEVVWLLAMALVNNILYLSDLKAGTVPKSSSEKIFDNFIDELSRNRKGKLPVSHYADILCITPQYLSRTVSLVSGKTASEWINKAVVADARILLHDSSKSISEISDALNFPNDSFFCRFFRRETGQTPTQYRKDAVDFLAVAPDNAANDQMFSPAAGLR